MRRMICAALLVGLLVLPALGLLELDDTVRLAKTLYALGRGESEETLLDLGSVVMNRVDSPRYPNSVYAVLRQPRQFASGTLYDEASYRAARAVMMGRRTLHAADMFYCPLDESAPAGSGEAVRVSGCYEFTAAEN